LDGLHLTHGNAAGLGGSEMSPETEQDAGGGLYIAFSTSFISRTHISNSTAPDGLGGGVYVFRSIVQFHALQVIQNFGFDGGGVCVTGSQVEMNQSLVADNTLDTSGVGSGVCVRDAVDRVDIPSVMTVRERELARNVGSAGLFIGMGVHFTMTYSLVQGQYGTDLSVGGGGLYLGDVAWAYLAHNDIVDNGGDVWGGGISISSIGNDGHILLEYNIFDSNRSSSGGGLHVWSGAPIIRHNAFLHNMAKVRGAGIYFACFPGSEEAVIAHNRLRENLLTGPAEQILDPYGGGGMFLKDCDGLRVESNTFLNNRVTGATYGGGILLDDSDVILANSIIAENEAGLGGSALYGTGASPYIIHNTFASNAGGSGGAIYAQDHWLTASPSRFILYNNIITNQAIGVHVENDSPLNLASVDGVLWYENGQNTKGTVFVDNELNGSPSYQMPDAQDYHISFGSTAVDAAVTTDRPLFVDIDRQVRPHYQAADLGADELWLSEASLDVLPTVSTAGQIVTYTLTITHLTDYLTQWTHLSILPYGLSYNGVWWCGGNDSGCGIWGNPPLFYLVIKPYGTAYLLAQILIPNDIASGMIISHSLLVTDSVDNFSSGYSTNQVTVEIVDNPMGQTLYLPSLFGKK